MAKRRKNRVSRGRGQRIFFILIILGVIFGLQPIFEFDLEARAQITEENISLSLSEQLLIIQGNSLLAISQPFNPEPERVQKMQVVITGYSSTPWETDDDPYITAAGTWVRDGIIANNYLPIGTKIRIPELFGEKIFVVEDRMSWKKGKYQIDIWFPDYWQALNFGAKRTYVEILEN